MKSHCSFVDVHSGVQFCTEDNSGYTADIVTATFLIIACSEPQINLSKIRIDVSFVTQQFHCVSLGKSQSIQSLKLDIARGAFCKANVVTVALHCICFCPWIDGSTLAIIYEKNQKDYNL